MMIFFDEVQGKVELDIICMDIYVIKLYIEKSEEIMNVSFEMELFVGGRYDNGLVGGMYVQRLSC